MMILREIPTGRTHRVRPSSRPGSTTCRHPPVLPPRILMLTMHDNAQCFVESLRAGASGYVLKSAADRDRTELTRYAIRVGLIEP
jgi:hypothetical protein